ncbi:MAG: HAMP domain-containing histidine kinase [Elusimicrobia bacterium]|nr:HAMP domain-containing histidine kinase [Elusimicrobiota bacterium]
MNEPRYGWAAHKHQSIFCVFLIALAILWRENQTLVYPHILYSLLALLALNLASSLWLRMTRGGSQYVPAALILSHCGTITAALNYSGGPESNLWVLFLMPIFSACLLLSRREIFWIALGALAFNAVFYAAHADAWDQGWVFGVGLKSGILLFSAAAIYHVVARARKAERSLELRRQDLQRMEELLGVVETKFEGARNTDVGMIISAVIHELNHPLTVLQGSIELLADQHPDMLGDLERMSRATSLCRQMLRLAREQAQGRELQLDSCDLKEILGSTVSLYERTLSEAGVKVSLELCREMLPIQASRIHIQRIVLNLLSNAKNAMPEGGAIQVKAELERDPAGLFEARVTVRDSGPGIPDEILARLFKPFSTTRADKGGTGLGLYLSREIAFRHRGYLHADNHPDGGARFVLTLPLDASARLSSVPAESVEVCG